jgi:hypothetical protein
MMGKPSKQLLVEGKNDAHVLFSLFKQHNISSSSTEKPSKDPDAIRIDLIFTGNNDIDPADHFEVQLMATPESGCLGIILDADFNLAGKWMALRNRLLKVGFPEQLIPEYPVENGSIIRGAELPTVGIWLMPDNKLEGELEHFLEFLVPEKNQNPLWALVVKSLESIPPEESFPKYVRRFKEQDRRKALIHTWLAWQESPGKPLGLAVTAGFFNANAPHALIFINWVRQLFLSNPI